MNNNISILITGASRGIGAAIAMELAKQNVTLYLHYYQSNDEITKIVDKCQKKGAKVFTLKADLSTLSGIKNFCNQLSLQNIKPDILINNAGITHFGLITDVNFADWDKIINLNLKAPFFCTKEVISTMIERRFGRIINISSIWGMIGAANEVLYSLTKGGLNTFTKALAKEVGPSNITVNAIAPGLIATDINNNFSEDEIKSIVAHLPIERIGSPEEVAKLVAFLISEDASYITGQILQINGGWN